MVVVLGGVGQLAGTIIAAIGLGLINKFLEPFTGAVLGKIFVLVIIILFIQKRPEGMFALRAVRRRPDVNWPASRITRLYGPRGWLLLAGFAAFIFIIIPAMRLLVPPNSPLHVSDYYALLIGKIMCYAMVALAMDLIWGYAGSCLWATAYSLRSAVMPWGCISCARLAPRDSTEADLPDFMVFLDWKDFPWYWAGTEYFSLAVLKILWCPDCWRLCSAGLLFVRASRASIFQSSRRRSRSRSCCSSSATTPASAATRLYRLQTDPWLFVVTPGNASKRIRHHRHLSDSDVFAVPVHRYVQVRPGAGSHPGRRIACDVFRL